MRGCFILFCFPCHSLTDSGNVNHADLLLESIRLLHQEGKIMHFYNFLDILVSTESSYILRELLAVA